MSALETLLAKCSTDAQRVAMLREALELEKAEHLETCLRWQAIERGLQKRIAKARKALREYAGNAPVAAAKAYAALNWWAR